MFGSGNSKNKKCPLLLSPIEKIDKWMNASHEIETRMQVIISCIKKKEKEVPICM